MSGWPSGLRRQTQGIDPSLIRAFWSSNEGVGSNPTSDKNFLYCFSKVYQNIKFGMKYTCYIYIFKKSMKVIKNLILGGSVSRINEFLHSKKHRSCAQIDVSYFLFYLPKEFIVTVGP